MKQEGVRKRNELWTIITDGTEEKMVPVKYTSVQRMEFMEAAAEWKLKSIEIQREEYLGRETYKRFISYEKIQDDTVIIRDNEVVGTFFKFSYMLRVPFRDANMSDIKPLYFAETGKEVYAGGYSSANENGNRDIEYRYAVVPADEMEESD